MKTDPLSQAIAAALDSTVPPGQPFVIGDHVTVVETTSASGDGVVVLSTTMTPGHLALLVKAVGNIIRDYLIEPTGQSETSGGDADAR